MKRILLVAAMCLLFAAPAMATETKPEIEKVHKICKEQCLKVDKKEACIEKCIKIENEKLMKKEEPKKQ